MATSPTEEKIAGKDKAARKEKRAAASAKKEERRAKRDAKRAQKVARSGKPGKPERLCTLATVEVKKADNGFTVAVSAQGGRGSITIAKNEVNQVLRDLNAAMEVIRAQL